MILARCPACATTFRVRPEQLQARGGRVRCGHCQHAFNALESRIPEDTEPTDTHSLAPTPAPAVEAPAEPPIFVLEEKPQEDAAPVEATEAAADAPQPEAIAAPADEDLLDLDDLLPADTPSPVAEPLADEPLADELIAEADIPPAPALPDDTPDAALPAEEGDGDAFDTPEEPAPADAPSFDLPDSEPVDAFPDEPAEASQPADEAAAPVAPFADIDIDIDAAQPWPPEASPTTEFGSDAHTADTTDERDDFDDVIASDAPPAVEPFEAPPFQPDWPSAADLDLKAPPAEPVDFDALLHKQDEDPTPPEALAATPHDQPWPASEEPAAMLAQAQAEAAHVPIEIDTSADPRRAEPKIVAETVETVESYEDADDEPPIEPEAEPATSPVLRQAAWTAGATLLSLALLAQGALVFRSEIVQSSPQTRPFMESLCGALGCELPLPRNAADIAIESSDIQPDAAREAFFTLHATLRNRAEFPQAYPHLEITLTDARDKALVRKVLEPAQWLPADAPKDAFAAKREVATRIAFEAPGVAAAGYRVYVFYP
ncbi:DUF3426 domain-containing protein [Zoogloea sp. 1C4]|uniref:DUF3426 domain-containing protein n=1 Tax=Zoogloea sp. 1C4 TaxID=2570190 RepID=UPI001291A3B8|nr:DUF3426 domain-containing protein [Zoogloea sp. 1C4]